MPHSRKPKWTKVEPSPSTFKPVPPAEPVEWTRQEAAKTDWVKVQAPETKWEKVEAPKSEWQRVTPDPDDEG